MGTHRKYAGKLKHWAPKCSLLYKIMGQYFENIRRYRGDGRISNFQVVGLLAFGDSVFWSENFTQMPPKIQQKQKNRKYAGKLKHWAPKCSLLYKIMGLFRKHQKIPWR